MPAHLLFDFDGTLADSLHVALEAYNAVAASHRVLPLTAERFAELRRLPLRERFAALGVSPWRLPALGRDVKREMARRADALVPFPGIPEALRALSAAGYRLNAISSNDEATIRAFLARQGLPAFDHVHPPGGLFGKDRTLRAHLRAERLAPEQALYVGDEERDLEAARRAGVRALAVTWGADTPERLEALAPAGLVHAPAELPQAVSRLLRP